jgi:carboxylesterase type B
MELTNKKKITYVFGSTDPTISYPLGPRASDLRLSLHMTGAWASFVYNHDPNHSNSPITWPDYRVGKQNMVFVADGEHVESDTYRHEGIKLLTEQRIQGCVGIDISV